MNRARSPLHRRAISRSATPECWPECWPLDEQAARGFSRAERELRRVHVHEQARLLAQLSRWASRRLRFGGLVAVFDLAALATTIVEARDERRWSRADGVGWALEIDLCLDGAPDDWPHAAELAHAALALRAGADQRLALALAELCGGETVAARARARSLLSIVQRARADERARRLDTHARVVVGLSHALEGDFERACEQLRAAQARHPASPATAAALDVLEARRSGETAACARRTPSRGARTARDRRCAARAVHTCLRAAAAAPVAAAFGDESRSDDPPAARRRHGSRAIGFPPAPEGDGAGPGSRRPARGDPPPPAPFPLIASFWGSVEP